MNDLLSDVDYEQVLDCIQGIHRCHDLESFPRQVLTELRKLVECYLAGYNEIDLQRHRFIVVFDPPRSDIEEALYAEFAKLMHEHPVITYFDKTGDGQALKISDFLGPEEYHERALYRDCYRHVGVEDQLSFAVQISPGFMIGIAFNRQERSFSERDRVCLNLVRPHIVQAYLYAAKLSGQKQQEIDLHAILRATGTGVIVTKVSGEVIHFSPGAFDSLSRYAPIPRSDPPRLPRRVLDWLREDSAGGETPPLVLVEHDAARLLVRRVRNKDRWLLLLSDEKEIAAGQAMERFALTPREREVLRWLAEGKSNSEIAVILGLTAGTVKLHVERILQKLGVENRIGAALLFHGVNTTEHPAR